MAQTIKKVALIDYIGGGLFGIVSKPPPPPLVPPQIAVSTRDSVIIRVYYIVTIE